MRLVRYGGAMSLDGYIAGPNGEYDWITMDPDIDFAGMTSQYDRSSSAARLSKRWHAWATPISRHPASKTLCFLVR